MPLSPAAARLITLGRTARSAPQQQVNPYDLEQEESLLSRVGQGTLGAVSAVGNLLDLPSSMARDVLTWMPGGTPEQNPFDQLLSPLSDTNRISGRELLSGAGFMAPNKETGMSGWLDDPMEAVRDIAGFGAEAVLDFPGFWGVKQAAKLGGKGLKRLPGAMPAARLGQRAVDPLRRYSKQLFHAPSGQRKTQIGQSVAERRFHQRETLRQSVMGRVTSSMRSLEKKGRLTQIESMRQRKMLEGILDVDEAILPELDNLMRLKDDIYERGAALGFPDHELDDVIDHMFRRMGGWVKDVYRAPAERSSGGLREFMTNIRDQKKRLDAFRGFDQGTEGVNRLFLDSMWDDIIEADPLDAAAKTMDTSRDHARAFMTTHPDALHPDTRRIWDSLPSDRQATLTRAITSQREDMVHAIVARQMVRNGIAEKYGDEIAETYIRRDNEGFRFFDEQGGVHHLSKSTIDELEDLGDGTFRWIDEPVGTGGPGFERIIRPDEADRLQELADMIVDIPEFRERGIFTNHWLDDMRESLLAQGTAHLNAEAIYEGLARSVTDELEYAIRLKSGDYKKTVGDLLRHPDFKPKYNVAIKQVADKMGITRAGMTIREQAAEAAKKIGGDDEMIDALEAGITKDLKNLDRRVVPDAEFNDLLGFVSSTQLADELNPLAKGIASFNNLFKMSVLTWPARYVRDRMSGAFRNVEAFVQSPKQLMQYFVAEKDAHKLLQGRMVGGLEHVPAVKQWMSQAGLEGPEGAAEAVKQMYHAWHGDMPSLWSDVAGVDEAIRSGADLVGDPRHLMENFPGETPLDAGNLFRTAVGRGKGGSLNPLETRGVYSRKTGDLRRDTAFGPAQAGEQVGRYTDNANRVAPFLFMLRGRAGDSLESAADAMRQVNQAQIDYAARNFTPTERNLKLFFPFYSFCMPVDHEIMTREGFKTYDQLQVGEDVLTLNQNSGVLEWQPVRAVNVFDHDGPLIRSERKAGYGRVHSFEFTDNHWWPVLTMPGHYANTNSTGRLCTGTLNVTRTWRQGYDLRQHDRVPCAGRFCETESILSPRHARILGWVLGDGFLRWRGNSCEMVVYQSPKKYLDEIIELLGTRPRPPHPDTGVIAVPVALEDIKAITKVFRAKQDVTRVVGRLSAESAEAMWDALFKAEGTTNEKGQQCFCQSPEVNPEILDAFLMLSYMTGRSASVAAKGAYIRRSKATFIGRKLSRFHYTGKVWCPTTDNSTWIVRHEGSTVITGNSSRNTAFVARQLYNKPHGTLGQVIRAQRLASDDRASTPEFIRQQGGAFLRHKPDGTKSFLNALGTMHEDALNMLGGPQDMALELASRLSPVFKFPLEAATGQSLFQRGPWGGRRLGDLDPPVGRLMNNVSRMFGGEEIRRPQPLMGSQILEHMIANSPLSRAVSTARTLTDLRKNVPERLMNTLTGLRVTDVSPLQQQRHLQQQLDFLSDQLGASQFTIRHFPDWFVERLSPEARARVEAAQQLQKMLEARRQSRR